MHTYNIINKMLLGALMLAPVVCACSGDDEEKAEEWLFLDDNNSTVYVEFDASLGEMTGNGEYSNTFMLDKFQVYGFNCALGYSVFGNTNSKEAQGVEVTRNLDDRTMWDYINNNPDGTKGMVKWASLVKYPISFYAISGAGADQATIGSKHNLPTLKVEMPRGKDGVVTSADTRDLLFAQALRLTPGVYLNDSTKVELNFEHMLPQMQLNASASSTNDLEVTVQQATLVGFASAAEYDFNEVRPAWTLYTPEGGSATTDVNLVLASPVTIDETLVALQDAGKGAFVLPQTITPWTSASQKNGAGIKLKARIRSKATGTYLAGSVSEFGEVYVPLDKMTLVSGSIYNINLMFHTIYNADGSIGYRASYKSEVTPWVNKDENLILK